MIYKIKLLYMEYKIQILLLHQIRHEFSVNKTFIYVLDEEKITLYLSDLSTH